MLEYFTMSLLFSIVIQVIMQYTTRFTDIIGNIVSYLVFFLFTSHLSLSPLDLYRFDNDVKRVSLLEGEINEEKNIEEKNNEEAHEKNVKSKPKLDIITMMIYIAFPVLVLSILFIIENPYSKNYIVRGTFFNLFTSPDKSKLIFHATNGYNYAKENVEKSKFSNFKEENIDKYLSLNLDSNAFIADSSDNNLIDYNNRCKVTMPKLNIEEILKIVKIDENTYEHNFNFNIDKILCIDALYIFINCDDCIKKVNGFDIDNKLRKKGDWDFAARVGKEIIDDEVMPNFKVNFNFTLNSNKYNYTFYLNTMKNSKDYIDYMDSFGEASCNSRRLRIVSDTLFKYEFVSPLN